MKKLISLLCVLSIVIGIAAVSAVSAGAVVDAAKTEVDVKKGQDVSYRLKLSNVESKVIGCDLSVYYDSSVLEPVSVLDFNDNDEDNWDGNFLANRSLDGEVLCNFSVIRGLKFNDPRSLITVNFKAKDNATTEISYYIRYLYDYKVFKEDKSQPQITSFKLTCDVDVNGDPVIEDAQPQLNVEVNQDKGIFINSVTGDSNDTDVDIPGVVKNKEKAIAAYEAYNSEEYDPAVENSMLYGDDGSTEIDAGGSNDNAVDVAANGSGSDQNSNVSGGSASAPEATAAPAATTSEGYFITATDASGNVTSTSDEAPTVASAAGTTGKKGGSSPALWIIIVLVVLAGGGAGVYFYMKKKKPADAAAPVSDSAPEAPENKE